MSPPGVIDVKNYHLETADEVAERIDAVLAAGVPAERLTLVPDCGFSQTARWATRAKLRALVAGRDLVLGRTPTPDRAPEGGTMDGHAITMLGTGLIGDFYTNTLHGQRGRDRVQVVYSRSAERGEAFRERWDIPESTTDLAAAVEPPRHRRRRRRACRTSCTRRPSGWRPRPARPSCARSRSAGPPRRRAGCSTRSRRPACSAGYLEDLCYTPKTLKAIAAVARRGDRRRDLGPLARDASRAAFAPGSGTAG